MPAAVLRAVYSDWKLIRSRGIVQVVLELPIEDANTAYEVLGGMPDASKSVWYAVARLAQPKETSEPARPRAETAPLETKPRGAKSYAQRIAILCNEVAFQRFLTEDRKIIIQNAEHAAAYIRGFCGVESRRDIREGTPAGNRWLMLASAYDAWMRAPAVGA